MMRSALLWASTNPTLAGRLPKMRFVRRAARRFMPGEGPADALREAGGLAEAGASAIVTLLGENVTSLDEAEGVVDHYLGVARDIEATSLDTEISIKPTQLGLALGREAALTNLRRLVGGVGDRMVWVDMESSVYVDDTLDLFRALRSERTNVGICLQSYLRRTPRDLESLLPLHPAVRLVKGAYRESDAVAFAKKREVDAAFQRLTTRLLREAHLGRTGRVALGTHDMRMVRHAKSRVHELGLAPDAWEVEMLYGIATSDQEDLIRGGTRLRVLISYGEQWFPWYMRRLAERPANMLFVAKKMVGM